jgi:hypothetical protein
MIVFSRPSKGSVAVMVGGPWKCKRQNAVAWIIKLNKKEGGWFVSPNPRLHTLLRAQGVRWDFSHPRGKLSDMKKYAVEFYTPLLAALEADMDACEVDHLAWLAHIESPEGIAEREELNSANAMLSAMLETAMPGKA